MQKITMFTGGGETLQYALDLNVLKICIQSFKKVWLETSIVYTRVLTLIGKVNYSFISVLKCLLKNKNNTRNSRVRKKFSKKKQQQNGKGWGVGGKEKNGQKRFVFSI